MTYSSWDEWLNGLDAPTRDRAIVLRDRFRSLGVVNPEIWAQSEIAEGIAQLSGLLFLRAVWTRVDKWAEPGAVESVRVSHDLVEAGADLVALRRFARQVAYETALGIVVALDRIDPDDVTEPGWVLLEASADGVPTERDLRGLHETFNDADPSGRGAADFLAPPPEP